MKANELRIGNLVFRINRSGKIHLPQENPLEVLQIGRHFSEVLLMGEIPAQKEEWIKISNGDLSPIPLNSEWLERLGFKSNIWTALWSKDDLSINIATPFYAWYGKESKTISDIKYVHQLQNLYFALTGQELEVKELVK